MTRISKNISSNELNNVYSGNDFLELVIGSKGKKNGQKLHTLISGNILLRVEKKNKTRKESAFINEKFIKKIISNKNFIKPNSTIILKNIIALDRQIKEKVNISTQRLLDGDEYGFIGFYRNIESRWQKIEELQNKLGLNLLREDKVSYCTKCNALRSGMGFSLPTSSNLNKVECLKCHNIINKRKIIKCLPDPIQQYINGGWLEDYIAAKLKKLGWKVWPHIFVYGSSGVKLEIDVLAVKNGYTLIVECKSGSSSDKELSIFLAKFNDIKTNLALFISTQKIQNQVKNLVKKNFSFHLYDNIKSDKNLEAQLKKLLK